MTREWFRGPHQFEALNFERLFRHGLIYFCSQVVRFLFAEIPGDLSFAIPNFRVDRRGGKEPAINDDCQPLADVLTGHFRKSFRPGVGEGDINPQFARRLVRDHAGRL